MAVDSLDGDLAARLRFRLGEGVTAGAAILVSLMPAFVAERTVSSVVVEILDLVDTIACDGNDPS